MRARFILIALLLITFAAQAQHLPTGTVYGKVTDEMGHPIEMANVVVPDLLIGQTTNAKGYYELTLLADTTLVIHFSFVGYEQKQASVRLKAGENKFVLSNDGAVRFVGRPAFAPDLKELRIDPVSK